MKNKEESIDNFAHQMRTNIAFLKFCGVWPPHKYGKNLYTAYTALIMVLLVIHVTVQLAYCLLTNDDLYTLLGSLYLTIPEILGIAKSLYLIRNVDTIKIIMDAIEASAREFRPCTVHQKRILVRFVSLWQRMFYVFVLSGHLAIMVLMVAPLMVRFQDGGRRLPFSAYYPLIDYEGSFKWYVVLYLQQAFAMYVVSVVIFNIDSFVGGLMGHLAGQCALLCDNLRMVREEYFGEDFHYCIQHHKEILKQMTFCGKIVENVSMIQFIATCFTLCICMYRIVGHQQSGSDFNLLNGLQHVQHVTVILLQILLYCWFGHNVTVESEQIPYAIYKSNWFVISDSLRREIVFFLRKSQEPIFMRAAGLFPLSLETFTKIIRISYSYFAFLQRTYNEN